MARKIPVADEAIAQVALDQIAEEFDNARNAGMMGDTRFTAFLLDAAARVQFQPSTRRLLLMFDLGMASSDEPTGT